MSDTTRPSTSSGARPFWVPASLDFDQLSPELQIAIKEIVDPCYRELVLEPKSALERASGVSFTHLTWLELFEAIRLNQGLARRLIKHKATHDLQESHELQLRLTAQKERMGRFILELRRFLQKFAETSPVPRPQP
jgi:hypothetical protein